MRKKITFTISTRKGEKFKTGTVYRFKWKDLYRALQILKDHIIAPQMIEFIEFLLGSNRILVEAHLWQILEFLEDNPSLLTNTTLCIGWIIASYGYTHGLRTSGESTFPLPRSIRRMRKPRLHDWRVDLKCPVCGKPYRIPKNVKAKALVLKRFGVWLERHLRNDPH